jgi:hypothetical protein
MKIDEHCIFSGFSADLKRFQQRLANHQDWKNAYTVWFI